MLVLTTMLTMVFYWVLFGVTVAAFLLLMYGIAIISGVLAELVEGTFLLRKHTSKGYHWFESNTLRQKGRKMIVEKWFYTPILYHDFEHHLLNKIQSEIDEILPKIMEKDLSNPWFDNVQTSFKYGDTDINDIKDYSLLTLNEEIIKASKKIWIHKELRIFQSWFNFSYKGNFQFDHSHTGINGSQISGVYYYKTNGNDGDIEFSTPINFNPLFGDRVVKYKPKIGRLLLFPSWLMHKVHINKSETVRISISFNLKT